MARMRAVDAAVLVLEKEGIDCAFGVPGAAINPFYSALKARGTVRHIRATHLASLGPVSSGQIIRAVLGAERVAEPLAARLHERSGGNPFFLEEVCRKLLEEGALPEMVLGNADAKHVLVCLVDYTCPHCREMQWARFVRNHQGLQNKAKHHRSTY